MSDGGVFVAAYPDRERAEADNDTVKDLHSEGAIVTYDATVVGKGMEDVGHVHKNEKPTRHGVWSLLSGRGLIFVGKPKLAEALEKELERATRRRSTPERPARSSTRARRDRTVESCYGPLVGVGRAET